MPDPALRLATHSLSLSQPILMGVVNITPDSFSDGGLHLIPEAAVDGALRLLKEGAHILDIGGESTRPGFTPVDAGEEWSRVEPVIRDVMARAPWAIISIDTSKAEVAQKALQAGAKIVNDIWGFQGDPRMAAVTAEAEAAAVLMHNRHEIDEAIDIVSDIERFWETSVAIARQAGLSDDKIVLDPGIGFGKTFDQNYVVLHALPRLKAFGFPVLLGASRKSLIGKLFDPAPAPTNRLPGTLAIHLMGLEAGVDIIRAHDIAEHRQAFAVYRSIKAGAPRPVSSGSSAPS